LHIPWSFRHWPRRDLHRRYDAPKIRSVGGDAVSDKGLDQSHALAVAREIFDAVPVLVLVFSGPEHHVVAANAA